MAYVHYNPNPQRLSVGDCTVRAISKATGSTWEDIYIGIGLEGFLIGDMPSANHVWGAYLKRKGFKRCIIPNTCPECYTVADFAREHPYGIYILALASHVVCVCDGDWYDSWDSGEELPIYYWHKEE